MGPIEKCTAKIHGAKIDRTNAACCVDMGVQRGPSPSAMPRGDTRPPCPQPAGPSPMPGGVHARCRTVPSTSSAGCRWSSSRATPHAQAPRTQWCPDCCMTRCLDARFLSGTPCGLVFRVITHRQTATLHGLALPPAPPDPIGGGIKAELLWTSGGTDGFEFSSE